MVKLKISILSFLIFGSLIFGQSLPYPQSAKFDSIIWHWDSHKHTAVESDLWPVTWGKDDHIYTSWGDGSGFNNINDNGRVSLGFGRIENSPENFEGINIWGGYQAENPATFKGKCNSLISVGGVLYGWVNTQNRTYPAMSDIKLAWSTDLGKTWKLTGWVFTSSDLFLPSSFINFGKDNENSRDEYIYSYGGLWSQPGKIQTNTYLVRVHKNHILEKNKYEFFKGLDNFGNPLWSLNASERKPVFTDKNGAEGAIAIYNKDINQFLLTVSHCPPNGSIVATVGRLGVFHAKEPWGPWSTVAYYNNWGNYGDMGENLGYHIPIKWISNDGKTFWVIYSSESHLDRFNMVKATLTQKKNVVTSKDSKTTEDFQLLNNFPNPFNMSTVIKFSLPSAGNMLLKIYNSLGETVTVLEKNITSPGIHSVTWNGKDQNGSPAASGIYFYELIFEGEKQFKAINKMILLK